MSDVNLMAEASHTPGPWFLLKPGSACIEAPSGNVAVTNLARASEADARLIAAAPELLFALKALVAWQAEIKHAVPLSYLDGANAAIAKAEGRS